MLQVRNVSKIYDDRTVVNDVSFDVAAGEIFALLGPNGAGKTTLIRMITDIIRPDGGTITFDGRAVGGPDRPRMAYLPEERGLYKKVPVLDALAYFGELKDLSAADARREAIILLEEFGLAAWAKKQVAALSKGMQQKLQLCSALIGKPQLLILDEPFTGLDPINVQVLEDVLQRRRSQGTTVLLSTHQMNKVEELCDRALMIHRGRRVLYGPIRQIMRERSDDTVWVRTSADLAQAPGVARVERENGAQRVHFAPGADSSALLAWLGAQKAEVEEFRHLTLPLEDIFVRVVEESGGTAR